MLLYYLDKGMLTHLAGRYAQSAAVFEKAKIKFDDLYTKSISQIAASWAVNDYAKDYNGDDHEYVLLLIFQALNYAAQGNIDEALVDVRRVDGALKLINGRYKEGQKNVYKDDAFARLLSGILWQASRTPEGLNDAHIAYKRALSLYQDPPQILKENIKLTTAFMEQGIRPSAQKANVYVIHYTGFSPVKVPQELFIPLGQGNFTKLSFPRFVNRPSLVKSSVVSALRHGSQQMQETALVQDIGGIAKEVLESHRAAVLAQAALRPLVKFAAQKTASDTLRERYGDMPADIFNILSGFYNVFTEQADLRSWQTLPNEIRLAHFQLDPGTYEFDAADLDGQKGLVEKRNIGTYALQAGETKFIVTRSYR